MYKKIILAFLFTFTSFSLLASINSDAPRFENIKVKEVNLTGVKSVEEVHMRLFHSLDFPFYYGHNLDALWDVLTEKDLNQVLLKITVDDEFDKLDKRFLDQFLSILEELRSVHQDFTFNFKIEY